MTESTIWWHLTQHTAKLALQIDRLLRRFNADLNPRAAAVDVENIGPIGGMVLLTLHEAGDLTAKALSEKMGRDKSQISRLIHHLEQRGLIAKAGDARDARRSILQLTDKGVSQVAAFHTALTATTDAICTPLSAAEVTTLSALLTKIHSADYSKS